MRVTPPRPVVFASMCVLGLALSARAQTGTPSVAFERQIVVQKVLPDSVAFSPDGRYLLMTGQTGDFTIPNANDPLAGLNVQISNARYVVLLLETGGYSVKKQMLKAPQKGLGGFFGAESPATFSADSRTAYALYDGAVRVFDVEKGKAAGSWGRDISELVFSLDRRCALAKHGDDSFEAFDLAGGQSLGRFPGAEGELVALSADRLYLVQVKDGNLNLRDLKKAEDNPLGAVPGKRTTGASLSADGKLLAATLDNGGVVLFNVPEKRKLGELPAVPKWDVSNPLVTPDGSLVLYTSSRTLKLWPVGATSSTGTEMKAHPFGVADVVFGRSPATIVTRGGLIDPILRVWTLSGGRPPGL